MLSALASCQTCPLLTSPSPGLRRTLMPWLWGSSNVGLVLPSMPIPVICTSQSPGVACSYLFPLPFTSSCSEQRQLLRCLPGTLSSGTSSPRTLLLKLQSRGRFSSLPSGGRGHACRPSSQPEGYCCFGQGHGDGEIYTYPPVGVC